MDMVFPPIGKFGLDPELDVEHFSSFVHWRLPLLDIKTLGLEGLLGLARDRGIKPLDSRGNSEYPYTDKLMKLLGWAR